MCDVSEGLAEEVWLQADPLQDVLRHAQYGIHRFDLFVTEEGETRDSKESVERVHLQRRGQYLVTSKLISGE